MPSPKKKSVTSKKTTKPATASKAAKPAKAAKAPKPATAGKAAKPVKAKSAAKSAKSAPVVAATPVTASATQPAMATVANDEIRARAHQLWVEGGRKVGNAQADWTRAESELRSERSKS